MWWWNRSSFTWAVKCHWHESTWSVMLAPCQPPPPPSPNTLYNISWRQCPDRELLHMNSVINIRLERKSSWNLQENLSHFVLYIRLHIYTILIILKGSCVWTHEGQGATFHKEDVGRSTCSLSNSWLWKLPCLLVILDPRRQWAVRILTPTKLQVNASPCCIQLWHSETRPAFNFKQDDEDNKEREQPQQVFTVNQSMLKKERYRITTIVKYNCIHVCRFYVVFFLKKSGLFSPISWHLLPRVWEDLHTQDKKHVIHEGLDERVIK